MQNADLQISKKYRRENVNINLLLFGRLISLLGTRLYNFTMSLYVLRVTNSASQFVITLIIGSLPKVILAPFAGILADRVKRKNIAVNIDLLSAVIVGLFLLVTSVTSLRVEYIYATSFILCICETFFDVTISSSLPNIVDNTSLVKINSLNQFVTSIATIAGPVIGGVIFGMVNMKLFIIANSVSFIVSAICNYFIDFEYNREGVPNNIMKKNGLKNSLLEGMQFVKGNSVIMSLFKLSILVNFFMVVGLTVPAPYIFNSVIGFNTAEIGVLSSVLPIGMMFGSVIMAKKKENTNMYKSIKYGGIILYSALISFSLPLFLHQIANKKMAEFILYLTIMFVIGILLMVINIPINVMLQKIIPDSLRGRVMGIVQTCVSAINPLAMIIAAVGLTILNAYILPLVSGIILLISTFIVVSDEFKKQIYGNKYKD